MTSPITTTIELQVGTKKQTFTGLLIQSATPIDCPDALVPLEYNDECEISITNHEPYIMIDKGYNSIFGWLFGFNRKPSYKQGATNVELVIHNSKLGITQTYIGNIK